MQRSPGKSKNSVTSILRVALLFIFFIPAISQACSCATQGNLIERRNLSDLVFVGHLVSEKVDSLNHEKEMEFSVNHMWKGGKKAEAKWMRVRTALESAACGFEFDFSDTVMIFATLEQNKCESFYSTSLCSENIINPTKRQIDSLWMQSQNKKSKLTK